MCSRKITDVPVEESVLLHPNVSRNSKNQSDENIVEKRVSINDGNALYTVSMTENDLL